MKAGIQIYKNIFLLKKHTKTVWIPAYAGMTLAFVVHKSMHKAVFEMTLYSLSVFKLNSVSVAS